MDWNNWMPTFIAALLTWKQSKWMYEQYVAYTCNGILFGHEKAWNSDTCSGMNFENMLSEDRHKGINIAWFYLYAVSRIGKFIEFEGSQTEVTRGVREGRIIT